MRSDLQKALILVWFTVSAALLGTVIAPLMLPAGTVFRLAPRCEAKARFGRECVLCGTTTAFVAIARGNLGEAQKSNAAALPLYSGFTANGLLAVAVLFRRLLKCR